MNRMLRSDWQPDWERWAFTEYIALLLMRLSA